MFQGIVALVMAVSIAWFGARAVSNPADVWDRRVRARGRATGSAPTPDELRRIKNAGVVSIGVGVIFALVAIVLTAKMAALESEMRELDQERDRYGVSAG